MTEKFNKARQVAPKHVEEYVRDPKTGRVISATIKVANPNRHRLQSRIVGLKKKAPASINDPEEEKASASINDMEMEQGNVVDKVANDLKIKSVSNSDESSDEPTNGPLTNWAETSIVPNKPKGLRTTRTYTKKARL